MKGGQYNKKTQFDIMNDHQKGKRPMPQTTKVSYNNSPQNRSKVNSMSNNIPPNKQSSSKQQPIGQPMGDIPLISQYYSFKNKDGAKMTQQDFIHQNEVLKKQSAQVTQSMLVRETKTGKR